MVPFGASNWTHDLRKLHTIKHADVVPFLRRERQPSYFSIPCPTKPHVKHVLEKMVNNIYRLELILIQVYSCF